MHRGDQRNDNFRHWFSRWFLLLVPLLSSHWIDRRETESIPCLTFIPYFNQTKRLSNFIKTGLIGFKSFPMVQVVGISAPTNEPSCIEVFWWLQLIILIIWRPINYEFVTIDVMKIFCTKWSNYYFCRRLWKRERKVHQKPKITIRNFRYCVFLSRWISKVLLCSRNIRLSGVCF